jgi:hypothetical protein
MTSTGSDNLIRATGAVIVRATDSVTVTASNGPIYIGSTTQASNLDSVSFTSGNGIFSASTSFEFSAYRGDVSVMAGQSILLETTTKNVEFEATTTGSSAYVTAKKQIASTATDSLLSGLNVRSVSVNGTTLEGNSLLASIGDRGINTYARSDSTVTGSSSVTFSSDESLYGKFGRDARMTSFGSVVVTSGAASNVTSSSGPVSIAATFGVASFTTGQNAMFSSGPSSDSSLTWNSAQAATFTATNLFSAQVTQDSLQFRGAQIDVQSTDRLSITGDFEAQFTGASVVSKSTAAVGIYGGAINFTSNNNKLFVEATKDVSIRSEIGSLYGFSTQKPAVNGIEDTINFRTKRHLSWTAGHTISAQAGANATYVINRMAIDDDDDGDGSMSFTANNGQVIFSTDVNNHDNDVQLFAGGALSLIAQSGTRPMKWSSAFDSVVRAARTVSITGHQSGAFTATAQTGYLRMNADAGMVSIVSRGDKATFASTRASSLGGAPVFVVASNQLSATAGSAQFIASGASPLSLPNAPGRTDGGQLISDVDGIVGVSVRTTDSSGNIAIDARNAGLTYSSADNIFVRSPNNAFFTTDSGATITAGSGNGAIEAEDGTVQIQGVTGTSFSSTKQMGFESSRLLEFYTQDTLSVTATAGAVNFLTQSGNIALRTQFFKDMTASAQSVAISGGSTSLTATDAIVGTAGNTAQLIGRRGVLFDTIGGKAYFQSQTATAADSSITASQDMSIEAGAKFTVTSADIVSFLGQRNSTLMSSGGGISLAASTSASITGAHTVELKSGSSTNQKLTSDRTLLQANTLSVTGTQRVVLDPTTNLRIGTSTKPTVTINGGGTAVDRGIGVQSQGNILLNTDTTYALTATTVAAVDSGYEGSDFTSTLQTNILAPGGSVSFTATNGAFDVSSATTIDIKAATGASFSSGGVLRVESQGASTATSIISVVSQDVLSITSPTIAVHTPSLLTTTGTTGTTTIQMTVERASELVAGTNIELKQTNAASTGLSVTSANWQAYQSDAQTAIGTPALKLSTGNANAFKVQTTGIASPISFTTQKQVSMTAVEAIAYTSTAGIAIDAGKGVNENIVSNVQFIAQLGLTLDAFEVRANASNALTLQSTAADVQLTTSGTGRTTFDSEGPMTITSTTDVISFTSSSNGLTAFRAGGDFLFTLSDALTTTAATSTTHRAGNAFVATSTTTLDLKADGGATIPSGIDEPNYSVALRATVDAPGLPLMVKAGGTMSLTGFGGNFLNAGQEVGDRGSVSMTAVGDVVVTTTVNDVSFTATSSPNDIDGTAPTTFSAATTTTIATIVTGTAFTISATGTEPDTGVVQISALTDVATFTATTTLDIASSKSAIYEATAISLKGVLATTVVATGPVASAQNSDYAIQFNAATSVTATSAAVLNIFPATDANLIGPVVSVSGNSLSLITFSTTDRGVDTGIDFVNHGSQGIAFYATGSTNAINLTPGGDLIVESEVGISIESTGSTITFASATTYIHSVDDMLFQTTGSNAQTISAAQDLSVNAAKTISFTTGTVTHADGAEIISGKQAVTITSSNFNLNRVDINAVDSVLIRNPAAVVHAMTTDVSFQSGTAKSSAPTGSIDTRASNIFISSTTLATSFTAGDNIRGSSQTGLNVAAVNQYSMYICSLALSLSLSLTVQHTQFVILLVVI